MAIQLEEVVREKQHLISLDEYDRMVEAGVFAPGTQIELLRGAIIDMSPQGPAHESCVALITRLFMRAAGDRAVVWPRGNSIGLSLPAIRALSPILPF